VLVAFEQGRIFVVPQLTSIFPVSSKGPSHSVASYGKQEVLWTYSNPDPHRKSHLLLATSHLKFTSLKTMQCAFTQKYSEVNVKKMQKVSVEKKIYVVFDDKLFYQLFGIPMSTVMLLYLWTCACVFYSKAST
jgi:hypothetical protein